MVNAQEWLDQEYPKEERSSVKKLFIYYKNLLGSLTVEGFTELEDFRCFYNHLTNLKIVNCPKLTLLHCWKNDLTNLDISECTNLRELNCYGNQLSDLDISSCSKLVVLWIWDNKLKSLDISNCPSLLEISYGKNLFTEQETNKLRKYENWKEYNSPFLSTTPLSMTTSFSPNNYSTDYISMTSFQSVQLSTNSFDYFNFATGSDFNTGIFGSENLISQNLTDFASNNAQEWLDHYYPLEKRAKTKELNLNTNPNNGKKITGSLKLEGFDNLENLDCSCQWLTELDCSNCQKLETIDCRGNNLTSLNLPNSNSLWRINCSDNYLTNLNFSSLNTEKLIELDIKNNNFFLQDISIFSRFVNLESLLIGNVLVNNASKEKLEKGIYNRFFGSLESLQKLVKLNYLNIGSTDVDSGLEYLPTELEKIYCSTDLGKRDWKVKKIQDQLKNYKNDYGDYNYKVWKNDKKKEWEINFLKSRIQELTNLIKQKKEKIINAYLHFFTEKELLRELITAYLEYKKAQKQELDCDELFEKFCELRRKLKVKVQKGTIEEVEKILNNCEELIHHEVELQKEINKNKKLIEGHQQVINNITYNIGNINVDKGHALISNNMGDNTDLKYKIEEVLETKMKIPLKKQVEKGNSLTAIDSEEARTKRQCSLSAESPDKIKSIRIGEEYECQSEPKEIDYATNNWKNINPNFTPELIQKWQSLNFTYSQCKEWIDIGLKITDAEFCVWLRDVKQVDSKWVLDYGNQEELSSEFFRWYQKQLQTNIEISPK